MTDPQFGKDDLSYRRNVINEVIRELEEETCHAEHHQLAELDQVGGGGLCHPAAVVNIQSAKSLSEHHCQSQPCPATLYLQVTLSALIMLFVAKFGRTK